MKIEFDKEWCEEKALAEEEAGVVPEAGVPSINPGILKTVELFNGLGFVTTDSGDGETHDFSCDRDVGYVVIVVPRTKNLADATEAVADILIEHGIKIGYYAPEENCYDTQVQGSFCPFDGLQLIDIHNITDKMMGLA